MAHAHFSPRLFRYLKDLEKHNDRKWFEANRERYELDVKEPLQQFIVDFAERVFARSPGGPAKVAVLGSGLMGSLSGSAVANAVTSSARAPPAGREFAFRDADRS